MYTSLFFDLDGTLTDSRIGITESVRHALITAGYDAPSREELEWVVGPSLRESFLKLTKSNNPQVAERLLALYRERFEPIGMFENLVYNGIPHALAQLKSMGLKLFIATSKPRVYAEKIVTHFHLDSFFESIAGAELDGSIDSKADVIRSLLTKYPHDTTTCLMIGDREHDVLGARKNGIDTLGVSYGFGTTEELIQAGAKSIVESPQAIVSFIKSSATRRETDKQST